MKHFSCSPTSICPSTDSILQLDIIFPHTREEEEEEEEKEEEEKEEDVGRQTQKTVKEALSRGGEQRSLSS